ncbi:carboxypeptidase M32 [Brevibacillus reuszeri]|uniref:carboxypeptidase M32 n=1 Tax=Brevibacillus reuszeri TaxID=54915 RepID=UPI001B1D0987|nr:carboxypeptidase M32 [Brevibacillus reuszeri]GIO06626.1 carboxypeptidase M32 [Brevibacillus reuszeri]
MPSTALEKQVSAFRELAKKIVSYGHTLAVLDWDMRVNGPSKGMESRAEMIGVMSGEHFKLLTSKEMESYLADLSEPDTLASLDPVIRGSVLEFKKEFEKNQKIPVDRYQENVVLTAQSATVWEQARAKNDFAMFRPYLEKVIAMQIEFIDYWGKRGNNVYDTLLDHYESGMTVSQLDNMFGLLREKTVPLLQAISNSAHQPDTSFLTKFFDEKQQEEFGRRIIAKLGYDFQAGRLDRSVHPFCTTFGSRDVRITTRFDPHFFNMALFGTIHEAGHAMYEQNISPDLFGTPLGTGTSMGIHESQSRFWENVVGRSLPFWKHFYKDLTAEFPSQFAGVDAGQFYRGINQVKPSLIRVEADELTYNLHIMIRYEIEKGLINKTYEVADLPEIWKQKMSDYLGIEVPTDKEGVLQDVHWSSGLFGYFPTYSLGNVYSAQFLHALKKEITDFDELIEHGEFTPIRSWLVDKIYQYGKLKSPNELLQDITGELTNASYLVDYLENKYKQIYQL